MKLTLNGEELPLPEPVIPQAMTLRLPIELAEWLREEAHRSRRTKTEIVVEALERYWESG